MNHWHPDLIIAERRIAEMWAQADRERLVADAAPRRPPLRLRIHLDFRLSFGRAAPPKTAG